MCRNTAHIHKVAAPPALLEAVRRGEEGSALKLLDSDVPMDVDGITNKHRDGTALFWAACRGMSKVALRLLETGSGTATRTKSGCTPLHGAADRGQDELVTILLSRNSDVRLQNFNGDTPAHLAAYRGHTGCLRLLAEGGSNLFVRNNEGKTVFETAFAEGHVTTIAFLEDIKRVMEEKEHLKQQHSGQQSQYQRNHVVQHQQRPVSDSGIHVTSATDSSRPHCVHPPSREAPEPLHIERSSPSVINIVRVAERNHLPRKKPTSCVAPPATLIAHGTRRVVIETLPRTTESSPSPRTCPAVSTKNTLLDERT